MRAIAVVLTFATATWGVGCGGEEPQPAAAVEVPKATGTDVVGETPVARALAPWKTDQPQHVRVQITHTVQPHDVYGPSKMKGDPSIGDPAHERTEFVLIPDPNPISAELAAFLKKQREGR